jgi:ABC-type uncharacterized transport system auxiliary subunit
MMRSILLLAALLPLVSACVSVDVANEPRAERLYVLHDAGLAGQARGAPRVPVLLVQALPSAAVAETLSIAYSPRPHELAYYQLAHWTDRPVRSIPRHLVQRLEAAGLSGAVGEFGGPLSGDWLLTLQVQRLEHDIAAPPGVAQLNFVAELFDRRQPGRVASAQFEAAVPVASADSAAAAEALSRALGNAFDALVVWLDERLPAAGVSAVPAGTAASAAGLGRDGRRLGDAHLAAGADQDHGVAGRQGLVALGLHDRAPVAVLELNEDLDRVLACAGALDGVADHAADHRAQHAQRD